MNQNINMQDSINTNILNADSIASDSITTVMELPAGKKGITFDNTPLNDTGTIGLVMIVFFVLAISFRNGYKYVYNFTNYMFSVRKRQNAFEDHTMSETQVKISLIANTCLMEGILFYIGINEHFPTFNLSANVFKTVSALTLLCGGFFVAQLVLFYIMGWVFARDKEDTRLWIEGFNASQAILGLSLFPIVFICMLYPATSNVLISIAFSLYILARFAFISKGFRIFFNNLSSCLYFILYLCTVEIVPVILICSGAIYLCEII